MQDNNLREENIVFFFCKIAMKLCTKYFHCTRVKYQKLCNT